MKEGDVVEEQVTFPAGNIQLEGLLWLPAQTPQRGVVLCHPHPQYGGDMQNNVISALAQALQQAGMATLRFNFRGVGHSSGEHGGGEAEIEDVNAAVSYLLSRQTLSAVAIAGYSFGSIVGLRAGAVDARVHKLVGVAFPLGFGDPSFVMAVTKPKLFISGDRDNFSPIAGLQELLNTAPAPKALVTVAGADHFFWGQENHVAEAVVEFLTK
jgi:uncharacterized protein